MLRHVMSGKRCGTNKYRKFKSDPFSSVQNDRNPLLETIAMSPLAFSANCGTYNSILHL